jgi:hypothetical protein
MPSEPTEDAESDLSAWPQERLEMEICLVAAQIAAAEARWLRLLAEFDRRRAWADWGCRSAAQWLSWQCAMAPVTAREHVRVARRLTAFPATATAFADGSLSFSKVRAMTRVLTPANESLVLEYARHATAGQLERLLRAYKGIRDEYEDRSAPDPGASRRARRSVSWHHEDNGMLVFEARLPPEEGALVLQALRAFDPHAEGVSAETSSDPDEPDGDAGPTTAAPPLPRCGFGAHWADALAAAAEAALAAGAPSMGRQPEVLLHLDLALLRTGDADPAGRAACHVDEGPDVTSDVARRLACDCGLRAVVHDGRTGATLDIGRLRRTPTAAQRAALWIRDGGCRFPGCGQRRYVDAHHIVHWIDGGTTDMANLLLLCRHHHRLVHEEGWHVTAVTDGDVLFARPDGAPLDVNQCPTREPRHAFPLATDSLCALTGPARYDIGMAVVGLLTEDGYPADLTPEAFKLAKAVG